MRSAFRPHANTGQLLVSSSFQFLLFPMMRQTRKSIRGGARPFNAVKSCRNKFPVSALVIGTAHGKVISAQYPTILDLLTHTEGGAGGQAGERGNIPHAYPRVGPLFGYQCHNRKIYSGLTRVLWSSTPSASTTKEPSLRPAGKLRSMALAWSRGASHLASKANRFVDVAATRPRSSRPRRCCSTRALLCTTTRAPRAPSCCSPR